MALFHGTLSIGYFLPFLELAISKACPRPGWVNKRESMHIPSPNFASKVMLPLDILCRSDQEHIALCPSPINKVVRLRVS
jgi:hypothetical protein